MFREFHSYKNFKLTAVTSTSSPRQSISVSALPCFVFNSILPITYFLKYFVCFTSLHISAPNRGDTDDPHERSGGNDGPIPFSNEKKESEFPNG